MPKISTVTITDFQKIASLKGGKCLSPRYKNSNSKLLFRCDKGHRWEALPDSIKKGSWCQKCFFMRFIESRKDSLESFIKIALDKGGKCLSTKYINGANKLKFECDKGHSFILTGIKIKTGRWCPECASKQKDDSKRLMIERVQKAAKKHDGKCLSTRLVLASKKLKFECDKGHQWMASPYAIINGSWCIKCFRETMNDKRKEKSKGK